jgi:hypothetical protein
MGLFSAFKTMPGMQRASIVALAMAGRGRPSVLVSGDFRYPVRLHCAIPRRFERTRAASLRHRLRSVQSTPFMREAWRAPLNITGDLHVC